MDKDCDLCQLYQRTCANHTKEREMGYYEITVLVGGAEEEVQQFEDGMEEEMVNFLDGIKQEDIEEKVEIFGLKHNHELGIECECIQFVTDHKPMWTNK